MGWVRLDVSPDASYLVIKDYAFNSQEGCIQAGELIPLSNGDNFEALTLKIFPNPALSKLFISGWNKKLNHADVLIYDLSGRKLLSQKISSSENEINVSTLTDGIYFLELKNEEQTIVKKFEVKK